MVPDITFDNLKVDDIKLKSDATEPTEVKEDEKVVTDGDDKDKIKDTADEAGKKDGDGGSADAASSSAQATDVLEVVDDADDTAAFNDLSEETGVEISSNDDIVKSLKELKELRSGNIPGISPALKKALDIEKAGGNLTAYFRALSLEEDKMSDHEVLRHSYLDKSETAKSNAKLAGMEWTREFKSRYSLYLAHQDIKDETEKSEFYQKNQEEIDYQKERYASDVAQARQSVKDLKDNFPVTVSQGMTKAEQDEIVVQYQKDAKATFAAFESIILPIEGEEVFAIGLNATTKPVVERWLNQPELFLKAIGFGEKKVDHKQLMNVMTLIANASEKDFGARFKKQILDNKNVDTLENQLGGNKEIKRGDSAPEGAQSAEDKIASSFEAKRNSGV